MTSRLRAGIAVDILGMRVIPVERTFLLLRETRGSVIAGATREPVAVVCCSPQGAWAMDLEGREMSIAELVRDVEDLQDAIDLAG